MSGTATDQKPPRGYKRTDVGVIPVDWACSRLGDLTTRVGSGITPTGGERVYTKEGRPFLRSQNVGWGTLVLNDLAFITDGIHASFSASELQEGDVLLNITGASIGRSAIADARVVGGNVNQHVCEIRPDRQRLDSKYLNSYLLSTSGQRQIDSFQAGGNRQGLNYGQIRSFLIPEPPLAEQRAIAEVLSDVDGLIGALEALIAKKRAIRQAAMQQLLTGQTRLPGFTGKWVAKQIGEFTDCTAGGTPSTLVSEYWGGSIRWMNSGELNLKMVRDVEGRITDRGLRESSTKLIPPRCVLVGLAGQGKTRGTVAMNLVELCTNQSIAAIFPNEHFVAEYLYYSLDARYDELRAMSTGDGGRGGLNLRIIRSIELPFPSREEQAAIATVLSDMDAEIAALERRRDRTQQIKQGMMQQLLTGRIRLVKPEVSAVQTETERKGTKAHSWAFNEAVVISTLAKHFGSERFPLGRMRYTKLSYLLHRHVEKRAEGYLKKAAGPYNPKTRYAGPEKIAKQNGYIKQHKGPQGHCGFVAADNVAEAEAYFEKWYGPEAIQWLLKHFRYQRSEQLELLATVDMAAEELRAAGKDVDVDGVKDVIGSHPEWQAKLDRPIFSDASIGEAIDTVSKLFGDEVED